jgi:hypothetical protein
MNLLVIIGVIIIASVVSSVITYFVATSRAHRTAAERTRALSDAIASLESEKAAFAQAAKAIRKALDDFLADIRVEERRYVRQHKILFAHRKSLVLQERIFFRNVPISSWVEHEIPVEEGADLDALAKTVSVFDAIEGGSSIARGSRALFLSKR